MLFNQKGEFILTRKLNQKEKLKDIKFTLFDIFGFVEKKSGGFVYDISESNQSIL